MKKTTEIKNSKLYRLIQSQPKGMVLLSTWLLSKGYAYALQQRYRSSGWLKSIGKGAMIRESDALYLTGALSALQSQAGVNLHIGGRTALGLHGFAHYLPVNDTQQATLFLEGRLTTLPVWFTSNVWQPNAQVYTCSLFTDDMAGMTNYQDGELTMLISTPARAMMECLYLCPLLFPLTEAQELMEGLTTLRPTQVQSLLEMCKSVKVKRLFLYLAEKSEHAWFKYIQTSAIELGVGDRSLAADGIYVPKYKLVLPKEIV